MKKKKKVLCRASINQRNNWSTKSIYLQLKPPYNQVYLTCIKTTIIVKSWNISRRSEMELKSKALTRKANLRLLIVLKQQINKFLKLSTKLHQRWQTLSVVHSNCHQSVTPEITVWITVDFAPLTIFNTNCRTLKKSKMTLKELLKKPKLRSTLCR